MTDNLKQRLSRYRFFAMIVILLLVTAGCAPGSLTRPTLNVTPHTIPVDLPQPTVTGGVPEMTTTETSVPLRLSEGQPQPQVTQAIAQAPSQPLPDDQINQILARLPELSPAPSDQLNFKLPQQPIPPPRPGETKNQPFPPPTEAVQPTPEASGPLQVLRFSPEGEIPVAPFISVTFNQPMVPLTTISELSASEVPVHLEPSLPGTWRWEGTRTLTFEYDSKLIDRLPKATLYRVTVPAGTKSANGGALEKAVEWTFTTPPPKMAAHYPAGIPQPANPLFFVSFDQRIEPEAVLPLIQLKAGNQAFGLKLAGQDLIQANPEVSNLAKSTLEGRWLAFQAKQPLPLDTAFTVTIGPGTPSAEGPLVTKEAESFDFSTYAPLKIVDHGCSYSGDNCQPLTPFFIRFNNPLDPKFFQEGMLKISPELPGVSANILGDTITIEGATTGQTTYTIVVSGDIQDTFGQKLGKDASLTFRVGPAQPVLTGPQQSFLTIDPAATKPVFSVYVINYPRLDVQIYAVEPSDWLNYLDYRINYQRNDVKVKVPGQRVFNKTITVNGAADTLNEVDIDLKQVMEGNFGQFVVIVEPHRSIFSTETYWPTVQAWVQVTQIALDAYTDHSEMVAWSTSLKDGSPLPGVKIEAGPTRQQYTTDKDGVARFPIPEGARYLVATSGNDQAILPHSDYYWDQNGWATSTIRDELRWYVFDDRQMYRPGEEVHIKGWMRKIGGKQNGDVGLVGSAVTGVSYRITEPQGNEIGTGRVQVNALGGFDFAFTLPEKVNLGTAQIILTAEGSLAGMDGAQSYHGFQVQEFRRPEFEVTARNETPGPYFAGEHAIAAVEAKYYAGGALPNADVTWQVTSTPSTYNPPNWPDFTFGTWTPWWVFEGPVAMGRPFGFPGGPTPKGETFTGQTDATGTHYLRLDFGTSDGPKPVSIAAQATVMDVNRQAWTDTTTMLVHPANLYIGLRSDRYFVERGTPIKIDFIVVDLDGKPVTSRQVDIQAARLEWKYRGGSWSEVEADTQKCSMASAAQALTCTFETAVGGTYRITGLVTDDLGRKNQTQFTRWVSGGKIPPARNVEQEKVTLIPEKETYQPGDVAQVLVQAPFTPAEGLLTVSRSGILYTQRFHIDQGGTATLKVPIEDKHIPDLNLQVDVNGSAPRTGDQGETIPNLPPRPAFATAQLTLKIPPLQRTLALKVTPDQPEMEPGKETTVGVVLKDASGKPVAGAEVAVVVVDEAVLALSNYKLEDPISIFYSIRSGDVSSVYSRSSIVLVNPQAMAQMASQDLANRTALPAAAPSPTMTAAMPSAAAKEAGAPGAAPQPIQVRVDFNPLAAFVPVVQTDDNGEARVAIKLPDNLTRYRVMAVAVDSGGSQFGIAESNLVARLPLMVRPSAPRFLNFGDRFELPVVVQNQTGEPMVVGVVLRATNLDLTGSHGFQVTVPAHDRVEVRFPVAAQMAGIAQFQVAAVSGAYSDAATNMLPVYTPATTEAFATYGVLDQGNTFQPVSSPQDIFPQFGGLEINTSSTALQALTDAVLYLVSYPFECTEQLSSRILGVAALRDVLTAFQAKGLPTAAEMEATVQKDIERLQGLQNADGGFPYWRRGQDSIPFNTIHVAHALQRAKLKGFAVPEAMQQRLLEYLRQVEKYYPSWYSLHTRETLSAYALYVRNLMGDRDPEKALKLLDEAGLEKLDLEAIGWLWQALQDYPQASKNLEDIRRYLNNRVVETAGAANFTTSYDEQAYLLLSSNRRADAILLESLIVDNPKSDLIPKLVNGLMAHRKEGRWLNTQENVFVLLALDRYFNTFESQTPDFVARFWLGETYAGSHEYHGRTAQRQETVIPMSYLVGETLGTPAIRDLIISKEGPGRLYYRLGLSYAPTNLDLKPLDMGFIVERTYEGVDHPEDVYKDADGIWHIKAGAKVRVRLTMVADNRRYHVALVDPLPAGLEIVNPALAVSGSVDQDPGSPGYRYYWWWGPWYEHQNMRDERAEAFTSLLWEGVYKYSYIARATTPGRFVVPPAKAEEMYSPEVFGRSGSNVVIVE